MLFITLHDRVFFFLCTFVTSTQVVNCAYDCYSPLSCSNQDVLLTEDVAGWGYDGMQQSSLSTTHDMEAWGAYSGFNTSHLSSGSGSDTECLGERSCSHSLSLGARDFECSALLSCHNSLISPSDYSTNSENTRLECDGEQSCSYSHISSIETIEGFGSLSLQNSVIDATQLQGVSEMSLPLRGYYAGWNLTLYCSQTSKCVVDCDGNACNGTRIFCISGCELEINCNEGSDCPNTYYIDQMDVMENIQNMDHVDNMHQNELQHYIPGLVDAAKLLDAQEMECNSNPTAKIWDDYAARREASSAVLTHGGPICCRSWLACEMNVGLLANDGNVVCSGGEACRQSKISLNVSSDGSGASGASELMGVFCSGSKSCQGAEITVFAHFGATTGSNADNAIIIHCGGLWSCESASITGSKLKVFCTGYSGACESATISGAQDVYALTHNAVSEATIDSAGVGEMHVHFGSYLSGSNAGGTCQLGDVCNYYCYAYRSCEMTASSFVCQGTCHVYCHDSEDSACLGINAIGEGTVHWHVLNATLQTDPTTTSMLSVAPTVETTFGSDGRPDGSSGVTDGDDLNPVSPEAEKGVDKELIGVWNRTGSYAMVLGVFVLCLVCLVNVWLYYFKYAKCTDNVRYASVFKYVHSCCDLYTDCCFVVVLYLESFNDLFLFGLIFVMIPYAMSCVAAVVWSIRWHQCKQDNAIRLQSYFNNYSIWIILLTLLGNFYGAVDLCRSKAFYLEPFFIPLKKDELRPLKYWRYINLVALENAPQLTLQIFYLTRAESLQTSVQPIVFISLSLTVLSLLLECLKMTMNVIEEIVQPRLAGQTCEKCTQGSFVIHCKQLKACHLFALDKIGDCLMLCLQSQESALDDVSDNLMSCEVYFIQNKLMLNEIKVCFETKTKKERDSITLCLRNMFRPASPLYHCFTRILRNSLKFGKTAFIVKDLELDGKKMKRNQRSQRTHLDTQAVGSIEGIASASSSGTIETSIIETSQASQVSHDHNGSQFAGSSSLEATVVPDEPPNHFRLHSTSCD